MSNINVNLTPYFKEFVEAKLGSGRYNNVSEVVREALRLMEERDQIHAAKLRAAIDEGENGGDAIPLDMERITTETQQERTARTTARGMKRHYANIQELLRNHLLRDEDQEAEKLIEDLRHVKTKGYFTKPELLVMCKWKDKRERRRTDWRANTEPEVVDISTQAFATNDEYKRITLLDGLKGVGIPIASAILTSTDPQAYGVIDIRVWQLLHLYGEVNYDPEGTYLSIRHWKDYLPKLRQWASEFEVGARNIERSLFEYHKTIQEGPLYK